MSKTKWDRALEVAKGWYPDADPETLERVRKHIFAKMVVNFKTIGRNSKGELVVHD
jgi:hypothetical protein